MAGSNKGKPAATKTIQDVIWPGTTGSVWIVKRGKLKRTRRATGLTKPLFQTLGEKLPFESIDEVRKDLVRIGTRTTGVYVAHDSMGTPRYIGRGNIFARLKARKKAHQLELLYYSFYVVEDKGHEREIETLLIRAAGSSLLFNSRKKRVDIRPGNVRDYEAGTVFYQRQRKTGQRTKA